MKKILGISGTMKRDGFSSTDFLLDIALEEARKQGAETKRIKLIDYNIEPCTGCGQCMNNQHCQLLQNPNDQLAELYAECCEADAFIFASPVYALSLPAIWKNWFDRCEPCNEEDLNYDYYCYDVVKQVKGKAFKGKSMAEIIVSAGSGLENAISSLSAAFTAVQLSVIAAVGISLIEFDAQPGILKQKWSRPIQEADFAINIAKSIGQRVFQTIGYSTYKIEKSNRIKNDISGNFQDVTLENYKGVKLKINELGSSKLLLIAFKREQAKMASIWFEKLSQMLPSEIKIFKMIEIEPHPHFISEEEIKEKIFSNCSDNEKDFLLLDWDLKFINSIPNFDENNPSIILFDNSTQKIIFKSSELPTEEVLKTFNWV